jgi:hypothetical protein
MVNLTYEDGLLKVKQHIEQCWERDLKFMMEYPDAPKWQYLTAKYGALKCEAFCLAIDKMLEDYKNLNK